MRKRTGKMLCSLLLCTTMTMMAVGCSSEGGSDDESTTTKRTPVLPKRPTETVVVSPDNASTTNGGVFEGWGTSLCWWANRVGYSDTLAEQAADLFFGENGLRLNVMRYNIGGGDDPEHKHITRTDSAVPGWLYWNEEAGEYQYDYDADHNQLNVLKRSVEAAGEDAYVEVFSNSPPYFMTVSGCSSGNEDPNSTNLASDYYGAFADYLAEVTKYIENDLEIPVKSVSPMNEPNTDYWGANSWKQEGCHIDPGEEQSLLLTETARAFKEQGLDHVLIVGSDETAPDKQVIAYNSYTNAAKAVIGRISTHTYSSNGSKELGNLAKSEGFNLWMSEVDGGDIAGSGAGQMGSALWIGKKIIEDINSLSPSAWVMWQIIDNHISSEGYNGNRDTGMPDINGGFWGAAVADHDNENIRLTQKYYGIGQFTRYIRPGFTLIHCGASTLAAYDKENKEVVIVAVNDDYLEREYVFDLSGFNNLGDTVKVVRTSGSLSGGEQWAELDDIEASGTGFTTTLIPSSITTFIISAEM